MTLNAIVSAPGLALVSRIAWRSVPAPVSPVDVTVQVFADAEAAARKSGMPMTIERGFIVWHSYGSEKAFMRNTAIWARVTLLAGQ